MPGKSIPAVYFHPDQVEGEGRDLVGRRSAGESFLKGWLRHAGSGPVEAVSDVGSAAAALTAKIRDLGHDREVRMAQLRGGGDFTRTGTILFPTPMFQSAPWRRLRHNPQSCSLVGLTHTVSTRRIVEGLHGLMSQPVEPWDAIICTSRAVQSVVRRQFELETEFFRRRFGATRMPLPHLPLIPLGIETADFAPLDGARDRLRAAHDVPADAVVVLTMGRLSVVEKANPVPLMMALEMAARTAQRPVHLWMCGWAGRPEEEALHREAAASICQTVAFRLLDGRDADIRRNVWAAADVFTLPADSIQETFGLVPVEAMAAGLPVVMPDWDGFRDTVLHGRTGFRVPTRMAAAGPGGASLAQRHADDTDGYLQYLTLVQSRIQIDVPSYARALSSLIQNDDLRRDMGAAAAAHARQSYDWAAIIPQYLALADELAAIRARTAATTLALSPGAISPIEVDSGDLYRDYPTETLDADTPLRAGSAASVEILALLGRISGHDLYRRHPASNALLLALASSVHAGRATTPRSLARDHAMALDAALGAVLTLAKWDLVRLPEIQPRP